MLSQQHFLLTPGKLALPLGHYSKRDGPPPHLRLVASVAQTSLATTQAHSQALG